MAKSGYCSITQDSQSVVNNTSTITVKGIITTSGESYRGDSRTGTYSIYQGGTLIRSGSFTHGAPTNSTTTLFSVTLTVNHNSDGTSGAITASYNYDSGWCTGTGSLSLTTIARASSISSISGNEFGVNMTVTISRQSTSFLHDVIYIRPDGIETLVGKKVATSCTFLPYESDCDFVPNSTSATVKIVVKTYSGSTLIGTVTKTHTMKVSDSIVPSLSFELSDASGYLDEFGAYVSGKSKLKVDITASGNYSSTIKSYNTTVDGKVYTTNPVESADVISSGTLTVKVSVTDSRSRTTTETEDIEVLSYDAPSISLLKVKRCDTDGTENDQGEYVKVTLSATATALNNKNTVSYTLKYKKSADSEYTSLVLSELANTYSVTEAEVILAADSGSSYDIKLILTDAFGSTLKSTVVSTGFTLMHFHESGRGIGFGKVTELEDVFDIAFQTRFIGGFLPIILDYETDFDTLMTPNVYAVANITTATYYVNCPITAGSGFLKIESYGDEGQLKQTCIYAHKTCPITYERYYYNGTWGDWNTKPVAKCGTKTISITAGENSAILFTNAQIASLFGHTFAGTKHYTCVITNADGSISSLHAHGTTFTSAGLYALFSTAPSAASSIKLNYVMFYMP